MPRKNPNPAARKRREKLRQKMAEQAQQKRDRQSIWKHPHQDILDEDVLSLPLSLAGFMAVIPRR